jgi:hypothetical protein
MVASLIIAKKVGGASAELSMKYASKITFGTSAFMMRNTAGRLGAKIASSERLQKWASKGGIVSNLALSTANKASKNSFDVRNNKAVQKAAGSKFGKEILPNLDLGSGTKKGGFIQRQKEAVKRNTEYAGQFKSIEDLRNEYNKMLEEKIRDPKGLVVRLAESETGKAYLDTLKEVRESNVNLKSAMNSFSEIANSDRAELQSEKARRKKIVDDASATQKQKEKELESVRSKLSIEQTAHVKKLEDIYDRANQGGDRGIYLKAITSVPFAELFTGMARPQREEVRRNAMKAETPEEKATKNVQKMIAKMIAEANESKPKEATA